MSGERIKQTYDDEAATDRRADRRTTTVFRPVLIETEEFAGFCLVRNLSPNGLMGRVYTQFAEGSPVSIQFNPDLIVAGFIIWSTEGQIGAQFDEIIDVQEVLASLGRETVRGRVNRAPRLQIQVTGELMIEGRPVSFEVQDISQRGIKARSSFLRPGDEVTVCLEGLEPRKAMVCWTQPGTAGLKFIRPLAFDQLAAWVIWQQVGESLVATPPIEVRIDTHGTKNRLVS